MTRLVTGPQGMTVGTLFLKIVAEIIPQHIWTVTLGDEPDEVIYPGGLGYVRWSLNDASGPSQPGYRVVEGSYDGLSLTLDSLSAQPWWGNEALARQVAGEISGGPGGVPEYGNPNNNFFGPWLAYALVESAGIAVVSYQGNSGILTGVGTFQGPSNSLNYLVEDVVVPVAGAGLSGPWLPIYQAELAIPIDYSGTAPLGFDVIESPGVVLTGELVSL